MIPAGRLNHRLVLQKPTTGSPNRTPSGAPDDSWQTVATVWGAIEPLRGREFLESQAVNSAVTARLRIRYRSDVDATWRALEGSTVYSIEAVIDVGGLKEETQLMCSQGANNG